MQVCAYTFCDEPRVVPSKLTLRIGAVRNMASAWKFGFLTVDIE